MKQRNWKRLIQVVLILLLLVSISTQLYRCATTETYRNLYHNGSPHLKITCKKKPYPLDQVKVDLSIGITDLDYNREIHNEAGTFCALYFTSWDYFEMDYSTLDTSDYRNLENHYFIKEISAQDAVSSAYGYYDVNGRIIFKHKESFVIPREVLEQYKRDNCILLVFIAITKTGDNFILSSIRNASIHYRIIDGEYVQFL